jgi:hypothetical protein
VLLDKPSNPIRDWLMSVAVDLRDDRSAGIGSHPAAGCDSGPKLARSSTMPTRPGYAFEPKLDGSVPC